MASEQIAIAGREISRSFGNGDVRTVAVRNVSLELGVGQMSLLMGPSGSGKTTLLAVLSGLLQPDSGQVTIFGEEIWRMSERRREAFRLRYCGFIFQGANLLPALTARDHLEMVLRWGTETPSAEIERKVTEMLALLGLEAKADLLPEHLSGGEKQRVAIGRALIKQPRLFFADEPTSALDWENGELVVELLRETAHESGATVVMVTHDPRIAPFADRIYRMEDGRLREASTPIGPAVIGVP